MKRYLIAFTTLMFAVLIMQYNQPSDCNLCSISENYTNPQLSPGEYMAHQRMFPYSEIKMDVYHEVYKQVAEKEKESKLFDYNWEFAGPTNIGGRITSIAVHPDSPSTIYLGAATGGVWKSENNGASWNYSFAGTALISIGDIAIDPNNENIIYVGTGEANSSSYSFMGDGMYKSIDAGQSWQHIGLEQSAYIGRVVVDYNNSNHLLVAASGNLFTPDAERGVYSSNDGGLSWQNVLFINDSTAAIDIVQHPSNPDVFYAAMWERMRGLTYRNSFGDGSGIYKSVDGGATWTELTNGLITDETAGRIGLSICTSNPNVLYASYDLPDYEVAVFKTTNGGDLWTPTNTGSLQGMFSNFGWYFGQVRVDPQNPDLAFVLGVQMYKTTNGGNSWSESGGWSVHVDHHAILFEETSGRILLGNDGGLYQSSDNGSNWSKINNLPFNQFYAMDIDYQNPQRLIGGTQDNNTIITDIGAVDDWYPVLGGDGMYCLIDYSNSNILYSEYQWGNLYKSTNGGNNMDYIGSQWSNDRVNWSAPLAMDPENPQILYFGTYRVWKSLNGGNSWTNISGDLTHGIDQYFYTITTIDISTLNTDIVVAGSGDGLVHVSTNAGNSWEDVSQGLPVRWITDVTTDPFDENTIYVTVSGFRWDEPIAHVFKTTDLGQNWQDISNDLPGIPVNVLVADPDNPGYLYVGTDAGIYFSNDDGLHWHSLNDGIYNVPVMTMKAHAPTRTLVIGTYGISMYRLNMDDVVTGMAENTSIEKERITVYPNPAADKVNLKVSNDMTFQVELFDVSGNLLLRSKGENSLDVSALSKGIYFVKFIDISGKTFQTEKLVKL